MSFVSRLVNHVFYNGFGTQSAGARVARNVTKSLGADGPGAEIAALGVGAFAGSVLGGLKMISPGAIIDTITKTDQELEERVNKMGEWGGLE